MSATPFRENLRGIVLISACNLLFLVNDSLIKLASADLPLSEIMFFRAVLASALLAPLVYWTGGYRQLRLLASWPVFWRTVGEIFAAFTYLFALFHIPIANANTIQQIVPLLITACGAIFLGEAVGWRRWTAILVGFAGVLVVVRPGFEGFSVFSLFALAGAVFITLRDMTTRVMPRGLSALLISLLTSTAVLVCTPVSALLFGETWVAPTPEALGLIAVAVVFLIGGYLTAIEFMRHGDISVVAPFRYTVIIWAIVIGFFVWGEIPDGAMIVGTIVIAASGIYTFARERNQARLRFEAASGEGL